jgi:2-polyprenyl-3-methyl-5-hydroxy-6-metoxy-1,4-benzoquinol methylase
MYYKSTRYNTSQTPDLNKVWGKLFSHVKPGATVLEFGCYDGGMSRILKEKYGCRVYGVEINQEAAERARKHLVELIIGDMEKIDFSKHLKNKKFDAFIFSDMIEHLQDPESLLKNVRALLKNDGYVLASIPNVAYAGVIFDLLRGEFNYSKTGLLDRSHLRFFTKNEIYYLFERTGYWISHVDRVISEFPQYTEFHTDLSRYSQDIITEILKDKEHLTYQFVIRAEKASEVNLIKYLKVKNRLLRTKLREAISSTKRFTEAEVQEMIAQKDKELYERDQVLQGREKEIYDLGMRLQEGDEALGEKNKALYDRDQRIQGQEQRIYELGVRLQEKEELVAQKDKELYERDQVLQGREKEIYDLGMKLQEKDEVIGQKDKALCERDQVLQDRGARIHELDWKLQEKDAVIQEKNGEIIRLDNFIKSRKWWQFWK